MKRSEFLKRSLFGAVTMPSIIENHFSIKAFNDSPMLQSLLNTTTDTNHVLVIIQLVGGNDGLNTVIPTDQYSKLSTARQNILIPENRVLALNGITGTGFHPAMTGMQTLFNEGKLNFVQGVGYPNQNFSHFRSTDIWTTASDTDQQLASGWLGRYLNSEYPNYPTGYPNTTVPDPLAIQIGSSVTPALQGPSTNVGVTIGSSVDLYNFVNGIQDPAPDSNAGYELTYLRTVARQTEQYGDVIEAAYNKGSNSATYPTSNSLADQLKAVARLVKGGLKTRVYMVSTNGLGSFDTHSNQVNVTDVTTGMHATLWSKVSEAITSFQRDLESLKIDERVIGMTFSEFGRRIKSNGSYGTDHGASAPMFLFGSKVRGGAFGTNPNLPTTIDVNSNLAMQYDFRSVYASILKQWFCASEADLQTVLLKNFQTLNLVQNNGSCITPTHEQNLAAGKSLVSVFPNPFTTRTNIEFESFGGHTSLQIFDVEGRLVAIPTDEVYAAGKYTLSFDAEMLPTGTYYCRLQNGSYQQTKPIMKVR